MQSPCRYHGLWEVEISLLRSVTSQLRAGEKEKKEGSQWSLRSLPSLTILWTQLFLHSMKSTTRDPNLFWTLGDSLRNKNSKYTFWLSVFTWLFWDVTAGGVSHPLQGPQLAAAGRGAVATGKCWWSTPVCNSSARDKWLFQFILLTRAEVSLFQTVTKGEHVVFRGKAAQAVIWAQRNREKGRKSVFEMIPLSRQVTVTWHKPKLICCLHNTLIHSCSQVLRVTVITQGVSTEQHVGEQTGKTAGRKQLSAVQARQPLQREEIFLRNSLSEETQEFPVILMPTVTAATKKGFCPGEMTFPMMGWQAAPEPFVLFQFLAYSMLFWLMLTAALTSSKWQSHYPHFTGAETHTEFILVIGSTTDPHTFVLPLNLSESSNIQQDCT